MDWKTVGGAVARIGAPILGGLLGGPAGASVASAIAASALGVENTPDAIDEAIRTDPDAALKLRQAEGANKVELARLLAEERTAQLAEVNRTMRAELISGNWFQKSWRPVFGYGTAISYTSQMFALSYVIVTDPTKAVAVIAAMAAMTGLWGIGLAVVGVAVWKRSDDKAAASGAPGAGFGILSAVAQRIAGGPK